jgi:hypothetical protein
MVVHGELQRRLLGVRRRPSEVAGTPKQLVHPLRDGLAFEH